MRSVVGYTATCLVAGGLLLVGCAKTEPMQEVVPPVRAQTVRLDGGSQSASYSGEVRGRYETNLAFQVSGKVMKRNVELGSVVSAGDSLMEINPKDIEQAVNVSSAQVYAAQSQLGLAKSNLERYRQLYEQNAVSRAQFEQYQNAYDMAVAAVRQSSAQYAQGSNQLGYSTLTADSAGVISSISAEAGQVVGGGQIVLTLVRDGEREIEINIPENRMEDLRKAETIRVSFWALPGIVLEGRVREVSPIADKISRTYKVRILLANPPQQLKLGMTANVEVAKKLSEKTTAFIPLSAIYQTDGTPKVWVIKEEIVTLKPVKIGEFGDGKVQVLEGLIHGEVIVTAGVHKLRERQKVKVTGDSL